MVIELERKYLFFKWGLWPNSLNILESKTFLTKYRPGEPDLSLEGLFPAIEFLVVGTVISVYIPCIQVSYKWAIFLTIFLYQLTLYDPCFRSDRKLTSFWIILQVVYISFSQDY